jgi:hypothetical protein|tara:strand:- start:472 stop:750 length:279 start_codon:yes stop_codon:yes gene_type:complete
MNIPKVVGISTKTPAERFEAMCVARRVHYRTRMNQHGDLPEDWLSSPTEWEYDDENRAAMCPHCGSEQSVIIRATAKKHFGCLDCHHESDRF